MAKQTVNIGASANDGTGDSPRDAGTKINENFTEVYTAQEAANVKSTYEANADTNEFDDAEKAKLGLIEASATADQTDLEIKTAYEANADTNAFTDAEQIIVASVDPTLVFMTSESDFNALAAANRDKFGGSGFVEFGKHYDGATYPNINEGMWPMPITGYENAFILGRYDGSGVGVSKSLSPVANVNGVASLIKGVNKYESYSARIDLPPAPLATNLVTNGTFDTDTSGWVGNGDAIYAVVSGELEVTRVTLGDSVYQTVESLKAGSPYKMVALLKAGTQDAFLRVEETFGGTDLVDSGVITSTSGQMVTLEFTPTTDSVAISLIASGGAGTAYFDNISVIELGKVERQDLVFLESWHEKVADKDIVYPFGNTQSLLATDESTALTAVNGSFTGFETYSLFGEWQADSELIGRGIVWSTMTDANKKKFVSDPENNVYLAEDGELVQVRYRIRVVEGLGADWESIDTQSNGAFGYGVGSYLGAKGRKVSITSEWSAGGDFVGCLNTTWRLNSESGQFSAQDTTSLFSANGVGIVVIPIALVSRRNRGAYHPVFNPNGTKSWNIADVGTGVRDWYESDSYGMRATSTVDCFDVDLINEGTGNIDTGVANLGNPDEKFFDAIYESDVLDLRNSSHKPLDLNRTLEREFNKLVAGETRGWEGGKRVVLVETITETLSTTSTGALHTVSNGTVNYAIGDFVMVADSTTGDLVRAGYVGEIYTASCELSDTYSGALASVGVAFDRTLGQVYNIYKVTADLIPYKTTLQCDIIGNPANYYRGVRDWNTGDAVIPETKLNDIAFVDSLTTGAGTLGNFYKSLGSNHIANSSDLTTFGQTNVTIAKDVTGPDGVTVDGWTVAPSTATTANIQWSDNLDFYAVGSIVVGSIYLKASSAADTTSSLHIYDGNVDPAKIVSILWSNSVATLGSVDYTNNLEDFGIEEVGDGWYRVWVIATIGAETTAVPLFRLYPDAVSGLETVFACRPQFERGRVPSDYKETTGTTLLDEVDSSTIDYTNTILWLDIGVDSAGSWITNGIAGTPLLVGENGESLIPTGSSKTFKMSRKAKAAPFLIVYTADQGKTYSHVEGTWVPSFWNSTTNSLESTSISAAATIMVFYETEASSFENAVNAEVLGLSDVFATTRADITRGALMASNLIGKVPVGVNGGYWFTPLTKIGMTVTTGKLFGPSHLVVDVVNTSNPAAKILPYLTRENGKLFLHSVFKEMKFDTGADLTADKTSITAGTPFTATANTLVQLSGFDNTIFNTFFLLYSDKTAVTWAASTFNNYFIDGSGNIIDSAGGVNIVLKPWNGNGWGDDNAFDIVDNVSTTTDDNANTILIGQKRIELPMFIGDGE
jgi:hypothetical protein